MTSAKLPQNVRYLVAACVLVAAIVTLAPVSRASGFFRDFNAFYCAGATIASGHDPYLAEPIGTCERRPRPEWVQGGAEKLSLPAPLPPYTLAPFVLLSRLPLVTAAWLWSAVLLAALAVTVWALRETTRMRVSTLAAVFAIDGYSAVFLGEIAAVAVAAIAVSVMLVQAGKPRGAALAAAVAMLEPHVGLPAALVLFLWFPAARLALAACGVSFAAISVWLVGVRTSIEYIHAVLPSHALSEVGSERQFSLTALFHLFGAPDKTALSAGFASYYVMLLLGIVVAYRLVRRNPDDGLSVAAAVALALFGGVFIHVAQMQAAVPAALLAFGRTTGRLKMIVGVSIVLLAVPWVQFTFLGLIFVPLAGLSVAYMTRYLLRRSMTASVFAALAATAFICGSIFALMSDAHVPSVNLPNIVPNDLAEVNWALHVAVQGQRDRVLFVFARLPTWCGITLLVGALCDLAFRPLASSTKRPLNAGLPAARIAVHATRTTAT